MNQIIKKFLSILIFGSALLLTVALSDLLFPLPHWIRTLCFAVGLACVGLWTLLIVSRRYTFMESDEIKLYDVRTNAEFRRLGFTAESRPVILIEPQEVPATLRHLVPLAERWAIACDVRRGDYFEKQPEEDIRNFWIAVQPHCQEINDWLDSMPDSTQEWPEAAIHFMYMLKAHSEATPPEELARLREEARKKKNL